MLALAHTARSHRRLVVVLALTLALLVLFAVLSALSLASSRAQGPMIDPNGAPVLLAQGPAIDPNG